MCHRLLAAAIPAVLSGTAGAAGSTAAGRIAAGSQHQTEQQGQQKSSCSFQTFIHFTFPFLHGNCNFLSCGSIISSPIHHVN